MKNTASLVLKPKIFWVPLLFLCLLLLLGLQAECIYFFVIRLPWAFTQALVIPLTILIPSLTGYALIRICKVFLTWGSNDFFKKVRHSDWIKRIGEDILAGIIDLIPAIILSLLIMVTYYLTAKLIGLAKPEGYQKFYSFLALISDRSFSASILEEILFRLFLMSGLAYCLVFIFSKNFSVAFSLIVTSILFASFHFVNEINTFSWANYLLYVTLGLILGYSFILTKTLWFSLGFHFGWDLFLGLVPLVIRISIQESTTWYYLGELVVCIFVIAFYAFFKNAYQSRKHWLW